MLFSFFVLFLYCINLQASRYVGKELCKKCHAEQVGLWQGSHHDLAMQHVNDETVLGDFSSAIFGYAGISSKFYKQKNKFMVRTDGADGKLHDYEIKYTFGVTPLQQYLVELKTGDCRCFLSPGIAEKCHKVVRDGFIYIPMRK